MTPSTFDNLLECLTKLGVAPIYIYWFITKNMTKDTDHHLNSQLRRYVGQNIEKKHGTTMPSPSTPRSQHRHVFPILEALQTL